MDTINLKSSTQRSRKLTTEKALRQLAGQPVGWLEPAGLGATDLTFVSQSAKAAAVKKGAGVMIGDYFVGVTTGADLLFSHPTIVY